MLPPPFHHALVLTGPTGSGKSRLALELADRLDAEIVSMDSMAVYRLMDIGTAKPTRAERSRVAHHLIDVLDPWETASVAWWLRQAATVTREIESRGKQVLFVGGTPLYLKALMFGLFEGPPADLELRQRLDREAEEKGPGALHERLGKVDPISAARLHANDRRRLVRALEVFELTGKPISAWQREWPSGSEIGVDDGKSGQADSEPASNTERLMDGFCYYLDPPREELHARIDRRVDEMFEAGLVEEVDALRRLPHPLSQAAQQALGYKEVLDHLAGGVSREETIVRVRTRTRQFAKRQMTWFRHLQGCQRATSELTRTLWRLKMER